MTRLPADVLAKLSPFDAATWVLAEQESDPSLGAVVAATRDPETGATQVAVETVIAGDGDPLQYLGPIVPDGWLRSTPTVVFKCVPDRRGPFVIGAWPTAYPGVYHLIGSLPSTDPRWQKLRRWINKAAPLTVPCLLDHSDFVGIGATLSEYGEVEVSRMTARRRSDMSSVGRSWPARAGTLRPSPVEAVYSSEDEGAAVRTMIVSAKGVIHAHLRRLAGASFYNGRFDLFEDLVLGRLARAADRRLHLLQNRQRRPDQALRPPISVRLPGPVLESREATGAVITELESLASVSVAVLHRNPYLHVIASDFLDGSNFDVLVTASNSIEVYPGFRASLGSFTRLTQQLADRFEALEIIEAPPMPPVSLNDLAGSL